VKRFTLIQTFNVIEFINILAKTYTSATLSDRFRVSVTRKIDFTVAERSRSISKVYFSLNK